MQMEMMSVVRNAIDYFNININININKRGKVPLKICFLCNNMLFYNTFVKVAFCSYFLKNNIFHFLYTIIIHQ